MRPPGRRRSHVLATALCVWFSTATQTVAASASSTATADHDQPWIPSPIRSFFGPIFLQERKANLLACSGFGTAINGICLCDSAHIGPNCEYDRCTADCNNRGKCLPDRKCQCDDGWKGAVCETKTLSVLSTLRDADLEVEVNGPLVPPSAEEQKKIKKVVQTANQLAERECPGACSGNGQCKDGSCFCLPGYSGPSCDSYCPNECTGRGHCVAGACLCFSAFKGADCSIRIACSDHGSENADGSCLCDEGFLGADCSIAATCPGDASCGGHGTCKLGTCRCDGGFSGISCETPPKECDPACPSNGTCDRQTGQCMCGAEPCSKPAAADGAGGGSNAEEDLAAKAAGEIAVAPEGKSCGDNGSWNASIKSCECKEGFHGEHCEIERCAGFSEEDGIDDCHDQGMCIHGQCHCLEGFGMKDGTSPNSCRDHVCAVDCGKNGECVEGQCKCADGWQGIGCREPACNNCNGRGLCTFLDSGEPGCICNKGFSGSQCEKSAFSAKECPGDCNGRGMCLDGRCVCKTGFYGPDCASKQCDLGMAGPDCNLKVCPKDCNGKGLCFAGKCNCWREYAGPDCSIPKQCYGACFEACAPGSAPERCEFCKGQCLTLSNSPVLGKHNPMDDLAQSFL
ncbi:unnamed protein product [Amoebophrya sp. A25]|nr:unnamed protein product [Amoebophrya sp. A25]|eukprot:GSA25T00018471001.1